jgi:FAD synthetase
MVKVMASGVFDLIHLGHLNYLEEALKLGDELVVVVATDETVRKIKHEPITNESIRVKLVEALKPVNKAVLGYEDDRYKIVEELKPDIIAIGFDQEHDEEQIKADLAKKGLEVQVVRLPKFDYDLDGTRKIIRKIIDLWSFTKKMEEIEGKK